MPSDLPTSERLNAPAISCKLLRNLANSGMIGIGMTSETQGADWMSNLDWLREREAKILARLRDEDSAGCRVSVRRCDRGARRDALAIIQRRIAELEAVDRIENPAEA